MLEIASGKEQERPRNDMVLIRSCKIHFAFGRFAADDADSFSFGLVERNVTRRGFGVFLNLCFTFLRFAPIGECPAISDDSLEVFVIFGFVDVCIAVFGGALED